MCRHGGNSRHLIEGIAVEECIDGCCDLVVSGKCLLKIQAILPHEGSPPSVQVDNARRVFVLQPEHLHVGCSVLKPCGVENLVCIVNDCGNSLILWIGGLEAKVQVT